MQIFVNWVETLDSPFYSAPPCIIWSEHCASLTLISLNLCQKYLKFRIPLLLPIKKWTFWYIKCLSMSSCTGVTNFWKTSTFLAHPIHQNILSICIQYQHKITIEQSVNVQLNICILCTKTHPAWIRKLGECIIFLWWRRWWTTSVPSGEWVIAFKRVEATWYRASGGLWSWWPRWCRCTFVLLWWKLWRFRGRHTPWR